MTFFYLHKQCYCHFCIEKWGRKKRCVCHYCHCSQDEFEALQRYAQKVADGHREKCPEDWPVQVRYTLIYCTCICTIMCFSILTFTANL